MAKSVSGFCLESRSELLESITAMTFDAIAPKVIVIQSGMAKSVSGFCLESRSELLESITAMTFDAIAPKVIVIQAH